MNEQTIKVDFNKEQLAAFDKRLRELVMPIAEDLSRIDAQHAQILKRIEAIEARLDDVCSVAVPTHSLWRSLVETQMSIAQKQKSVHGRWQIWRPFFAWKRGRTKAPIVLGLTDAEVSLIQWTLNRLAPYHANLGQAERKNIPICNRILDRRNLRPLDETEHGEIHRA